MFAGPGDLVSFDFPKAGWPGDSENAQKYIEIGHVYVVESLELRPFSSTYSIVGIPNARFNTVLFGFPSKLKKLLHKIKQRS